MTGDDRRLDSTVGHNTIRQCWVHGSDQMQLQDSCSSHWSCYKAALIWAELCTYMLASVTRSQVYPILRSYFSRIAKQQGADISYCTSADNHDLWKIVSVDIHHIQYLIKKLTILHDLSFIPWVGVLYMHSLYCWCNNSILSRNNQPYQ